MKSIKRALSLFFAVLLVVSSSCLLISCSGKETPPKKSKRTNVYASTELMKSDVGTDYYNIMQAGEETYVFGEKTAYILRDKDGNELSRGNGYPDWETEIPEDCWYDYVYTDVFCVYSPEKEGFETTEIERLPEEYGYVSARAVSADGKIRVISQAWSWGEGDGSDFHTGIYTGEIDMTSSRTGKYKDMRLINDELKSVGIDAENGYISYLWSVGDGWLAAFEGESKLCLFDSSFTPRSVFEYGEIGWIRSAILFGERVLITFYPNDGTGSVVREWKNGALVETDLPGFGEIVSEKDCVGSAGEKIYFRDQSGIGVFDRQSGAYAEILNFINSDIDYSCLGSITPLKGDAFFAYSVDYEKDEYTFVRLEKVPDDLLEEEIILEVGCLYAYNIQKAVLAFNRQNTGVRLTVRSYERYSNEENEWTGAQTAFENDILSGKMTDIVLLDSEMPVTSYFRRGLFADLNDFIDDKEIGFDRSLLLENVLEASRYKGKQYSLIYSFNLHTLAAKSSFVGEKPGKTLREMLDVLEKLPEGTLPIRSINRGELIDNLFTYGLSSFVDWDSARMTCSESELARLFSQIARCPEKTISEEFYENNEDHSSAEYIELEEKTGMSLWKGEELFSVQVLSVPDAILSVYGVFADSDFTMVGYPCESGNGAVIDPLFEVAIRADSGARKEAWSFLRFLLTYENTTIYYGIPLLRSAMEKKCEDALNGNGGWITRDGAVVKDILYPGGSDDDYGWMLEQGYSPEYVEFRRKGKNKIDREAIDRFVETVEGASAVVRADKGLTGIITEELSAFLSGAKSAEETARIVKSKAELYISEHS